MNIAFYLKELRKKNISLSVESGKVRISSRKGFITDSIRQAIFEHKKEIVEYLEIEQEKSENEERLRRKRFFISKSMEDVLDRSLNKHGISGASVSLFYDCNIYNSCAGYKPNESKELIDSDTKFEIGCATKIVISIMVARLAEEGLISLDAPVLGYMSSQSSSNIEKLKDVTVRDLLMHSSGLTLARAVSQDKIVTIDDLISVSDKIFPSGSRFSYDSFGVCFLAMLVQIVIRSNWKSYLYKKILQPLNITFFDDFVANSESFSDVKETSDFVNGLGIYCKPKDFLQLVKLFIAEENLGLGSLLKPDILKEMQKIHISIPYSQSHPGWGLGWAIDQYGGVLQLGSTSMGSSYFHFNMEIGVAWYLSTNTSDSWALNSEVTAEIYDLFYGDAPAKYKGNTLGDDVEYYNNDIDYSGIYNNAHIQYSIFRKEGSYHCIKDESSGVSTEYFLEEVSPFEVKVTPVDGGTKHMYYFLVDNFDKSKVEFLQDNWTIYKKALTEIP